jgi:hypothetical protein
MRGYDILSFAEVSDLFGGVRIELRDWVKMWTDRVPNWQFGPNSSRISRD